MSYRTPAPRSTRLWYVTCIWVETATRSRLVFEWVRAKESADAIEMVLGKLPGERQYKVGRAICGEDFADAETQWPDETAIAPAAEVTL